MMDLHAIPITQAGGDGKFILYRPLRGIAFVGNRVMVDLARLVMQGKDKPGLAADNGPMTFLESIGFLEPDPPDPVEAEKAFRPTTAVLLMTNQCQLRCIYCYASAGELPREELKPELGKAVIDYVCRQARERDLPNFAVSFHGGGEPTYVWDALQDCATYARQKSLPARLSLTSNGIWSPKQRSWIIANFDDVSLSVDGGPATQDRQRPFDSGRGSASFVLETIAELDRHHFPYGIRMTATAPWHQLPEDVRFLCTETGCRTIQVEPAFNTARGGHGAATEVMGRVFAAAFLEAHEIAAQAGRRLSYAGARLGLATTRFCSAPFDALIVNPRGELVTCYEVTGPTHPLHNLSVIGRIEDGRVQIDQQARQRLHALMAQRRQNCKGCFCYWSCAGDCYVRTFEDRTEGHLIRGPRCLMNQFITEGLLLSRIADGNGVWRQERRQIIAESPASSEEQMPVITI